MDYQLLLYGDLIGTFTFDSKNNRFMYLEGDTNRVKTIVDNFIQQHNITKLSLVPNKMQESFFGGLNIRPIESND